MWIVFCLINRGNAMFFARTVFAASLLGAAALPAQAIELTDLSGVVASASSCYLGCGNAQYDAGNILDGDYGATGNTGLNAWNAGGYAGYVQVNLGSVYLLESIELYGGYPYANNFSLAVSSDGSNWATIYSGTYQDVPGLTHDGVNYPGHAKYGAVVNVVDINAQYVRYSASSAQWAYLYEMDVQGHVVTAVPEPETYALMLAGLGLVGFAGRRQSK
jgi:hypothetical protein